MRLNTLLLLVAITFFNSLHAQDKFGPGYYLANGIDTVRGFIEYRSNYNYEFKFRKNLRDESKTFTIDEVGQFGLDYGTTFRKLDFALDDLATKPVFAQILIQGDITLYQYQGRLFVDGGERKKFLLAKGKGRNTEESQKNFQKNTGVFNILFFDCPSLRENAAKSTINRITTTGLVINYHECKKMPYTLLNQTKKRSVKYGFFIGYSLDNLSYSSSNYLARTTFNNPSRNLSLGVISFNYGRQASSVISLQQMLFFSKATYEGTSFLSYEAGGYAFEETSTSHIEYSKLAYSLGPRFSIRSNHINPYLSLGLMTNGLFGVKAKSIITNKINDSSETREEVPLQSAINLGAWASVGLSKKVKEHIVFADLTLENNNLKGSGKVNSLSGRLGLLF
ncbi:MAG: hypothetical protein JNM78_15705 [Cyclobacteriaceae bacterium]|nr:hypothetical protein [Cyclobacteriaceae bacterium]